MQTQAKSLRQSNLSSAEANLSGRVRMFRTGLMLSALLVLAQVTGVVAHEDGSLDYSISYHDTPKLRWKTRIENHSLFESNAVVLSPFDDDTLYATTFQSHLAVISATDGTVRKIVRPESRSFIENGVSKRWQTRCKSQVAFVTLDNGNQILVYVVADTAPIGSDYASKT